MSYPDVIIVPSYSYSYSSYSSQLTIGLLLIVATLLPSSLNSPVSIDVSDDEDWSTELIYPLRRKAQKKIYRLGCPPLHLFLN